MNGVWSEGCSGWMNSTINIHSLSLSLSLSLSHFDNILTWGRPWDIKESFERDFTIKRLKLRDLNYLNHVSHFQFRKCSVFLHFLKLCFSFTVAHFLAWCVPTPRGRERVEVKKKNKMKKEKKKKSWISKEKNTFLICSSALEKN